MQWLEWIYIAGAMVFLFGAAVFVHEWGHYWMARRRGFKVEGFSIGFGPKMFGWTDRHGVEWAVRWIPAGGFVKLPQMLTSELIEGEGDKSLPRTSPVSRILVSLAGPAMNVVFAFAIATLIWRVGLPVAVNPALVGYVEPGSPEMELGVQEGDRIVRVDGRDVRSWEDVQQYTALALTNVVPVELERDGARFTRHLPATVHPDLGLKLLNLAPLDHPVAAEVQPGSAAEAAGLRAGDQFVSFAGIPVLGQAQLVSLIRKRPDTPGEFEILRDGQTVRLQVTPVVDPADGVARIGVLLTGSTRTTYQVQRPGPTPAEQFGRVFTMMRDTFGALLHPRQSGVSVKDVSGPVGILGLLAGELRVDYRRALNFMVLLNLNLAVLNLLPIPVLDGGHILMAMYELVTRRKVSARFQEVATLGCAMLLLSFMVYVTFHDVTRRLPLLGSYLRHETVVTPAEPVPVRPEAPSAPATP